LVIIEGIPRLGSSLLEDTTFKKCHPEMSCKP